MNNQLFEYETDPELLQIINRIDRVLETLSRLEQENQVWIVKHSKVGSRKNPVDIAAIEDKQIKERVNIIAAGHLLCTGPKQQFFQCEDLLRRVCEYV